jgi:hypothetical protein
MDEASYNFLFSNLLYLFFYQRKFFSPILSFYWFLNLNHYLVISFFISSKKLVYNKVLFSS